MLFTLLPDLAIFSRILIGFSPTFLVPLAWAWFLDAHHHLFVWEAGFALSLGSGP